MVFILYIVGAADILSGGRIKITGLFRKHVDQVCLVIDVETEMILVLPTQDNVHNFGAVQTIDDKNRLTIPKWMLQELKNCTRLLFVVDGDNHYLSPKTGPILPLEDGPASR